MQLIRYTNWVESQVNQLTPPQVMQNWGAMWKNTLSALYNPPTITAVYEHASLVVARWEFLGALYRGTAGNTGVEDARAYADRFLSAYRPLHNLTGACPTKRSEFFSVFRDRCLHGFTPAGVFQRLHSNGDVFGWSIGAHPAGAHRQLDVAGNVQIDSATLQEEFTRSIADYVAYLIANNDPGFPLSPQERWRKGCWGRFCPVHYDPRTWEQEGRNRGLY
ncbi:MAG TPA: hypothetical protein VGY54_01630 [Polyangiaceae bacterium]|jgi:hypothetical protein|nr:hypothetical protein [Polyangiaceae bacterium]